ncbi:hypothetical protein DFH09DRAFT_1404938 [Mycena vulgaris]|nr:hypothetical protein DFH09DRAFT_1404938 [Mycena vulgaris]
MGTKDSYSHLRPKEGEAVAEAEVYGEQVHMRALLLRHRQAHLDQLIRGYGGHPLGRQLDPGLATYGCCLTEPAAGDLSALWRRCIRPSVIAQGVVYTAAPLALQRHLSTPPALMPHQCGRPNRPLPALHLQLADSMQLCSPSASTRRPPLPLVLALVLVVNTLTLVLVPGTVPTFFPRDAAVLTLETLLPLALHHALLMQILCFVRVCASGVVRVPLGVCPARWTAPHALDLVSPPSQAGVVVCIGNRAERDPLDTLVEAQL